MGKKPARLREELSLSPLAVRSTCTGPWQKLASPCPGSLSHPSPASPTQAVVPHLCHLHPGPGMLKGFRASLGGSVPSDVMGVAHLSAAFSPVDKLTAVQSCQHQWRGNPACSASLQHLILHAESMEIFSLSPFHSCPFFIPPITFSKIHRYSSACRNPTELFLLHPRAVQQRW